ncbi:MAG: hypothetical protein DRI90_24940 [Deltaproteobacteria bacterium]|nr:MAG: hypothetical protein DRI90_24940 [Deltaproteobacteria bacterium]
MGPLPQLSRRASVAPKLLVAVAMALTLWVTAGETHAGAAGQCLGEVASWGPEAPLPPRRSEKDAYWDRWMSDGSVARGPVHHREIPMSLNEGASAIAPLTARPVDDSRIEATPRCSPWDGPELWVSGSDRQPDKSPPATGEVVAPSLTEPEPVAPALRVLPRQIDDQKAAGHRCTVYRPPRG